MPAKKQAPQLPSPWKEFLAEFDRILREPLELHCIGGFVFAYFYGLPRTTADIDYYNAIPANLNLDDVAGQGSPLHAKYGVWLHRLHPLQTGAERRESLFALNNLRHCNLQEIAAFAG